MRGHLDRAGHLGHLCMDPDGPPGICGTPGAFEDMVSNATLEHRSGGRFQHTRDLVEAYRDGDGQATCLWRRTVWCLASGIVSIINAIDPERLVLGGGIAAAGAALFDLLHENLTHLEWRPGGTQVRIEPAQLGHRAGAIGAVRFAADQTLTNRNPWV